MTEREVFNRIWDKARRWLSNEEFNNWLCFCYGAMSVTTFDEGRRQLADSIHGRIYSIIAERGLKRKWR